MNMLMTKIILELNKSIEENASFYYETAKRIKKKRLGAEEALAKNLVKLEQVKKEQLKEEIHKTKSPPRKKEWYEKFRWFITSTGFLVIGGRDATSNEIIIKKYTDDGDVVFHTDLAGSPFFIIKSQLDVPPYNHDSSINDSTLKEVADATVSYSRTWRLGLANSPVFYVKPEQVTKEAPSGEYLVKGAFVIKGKTNYVANKMDIAIGLAKDGKVMGGPIEAIKTHCEKFVEIVQGKEKASAVAKYIQKKIGGTVDEIVAVLPSGGCAIKR